MGDENGNVETRRQRNWRTHYYMECTCKSSVVHTSITTYAYILYIKFYAFVYSIHVYIVYTNKHTFRSSRRVGAQRQQANTSSANACSALRARARARTRTRHGGSVPFSVLVVVVVVIVSLPSSLSSSQSLMPMPMFQSTMLKQHTHEPPLLLPLSGTINQLWCGGTGAVTRCLNVLYSRLDAAHRADTAPQNSLYLLCVVGAQKMFVVCRGVVGCGGNNNDDNGDGLFMLFLITHAKRSSLSLARGRLLSNGAKCCVRERARDFVLQCVCLGTYVRMRRAGWASSQMCSRRCACVGVADDVDGGG